MLNSDIFASSTFGHPLTLESPTAEAMIDDAQRAGLWPVDVRQAQSVNLVDVDGVNVPAQKSGLIGEYHGGERRALGVNGSRFKHTTPAQWQELVKAAVAAGATPYGSHGWGGKVAAMFSVASHRNGIESTLCLFDSFDGTSKLIAGDASVRPFCANQMSALCGHAKRGKKGDWFKISHTSTLDEKINRLAAGIAAVAAEGESLSALFDRAALVQLPTAAAKAAFDVFFPEAAADATPKAKTLADQRRAAARIAAAMPCNRLGGRGNLATLWNASTYLVDRNEDGTARESRGDSSSVGSMLTGSRGRRVEETRHLIEVILADGRVEAMTVGEATELGVDAGPSLLGAMVEAAAAASN